MNRDIKIRYVYASSGRGCVYLGSFSLLWVSQPGSWWTYGVCVCVAPSSWQQWFGGDTLSFLSLKTTHHYCSPTNHPSVQLRKARPLSPSFFTLYHPFLLQHFLSSSLLTVVKPELLVDLLAALPKISRRFIATNSQFVAKHCSKPQIFMLDPRVLQKYAAWLLMQICIKSSKFSLLHSTLLIAHYLFI